MFKTAKLYALLAIIVASTAVSLFGFPQNTYAQSADPGEIDSTLVQQTRNTIYQNLVSQCLDNYGTVVTTVEDFESGVNLLSGYNGSGATDTDDSGWRAGYIVDSSDEKLSCNENALIEGYKKAVGYTTPSQYQGDLAVFHFICT